MSPAAASAPSSEQREHLHALLGLPKGKSVESLLLNDQEEDGTKFGDRYEFIRIVGQGAFGVVLHVVKKTAAHGPRRDESTDRALKIMTKPNVPSQEYELIRNEALILQQL